MKKLLSVILTMFAIQAGMAQSVLPNGDFENWTQVGVAPAQIWQVDGNFWGTLNELYLLPTPKGPATVFRTDTCYTGQYAARLASGLMLYMPQNIFIPGMLGTTQLDMLNATIHLGKPCPNCKPLRFKGYYKYKPVNGDSCTALLVVSKWNSELNKRDTVGFVRQDFHGIVDTYTAFDLTVNYLNPDMAPDSLTILLVSSGGFSVSNLQGGAGQVGSTMWVDAVTVDYPAGIQQLIGRDISVNIFPNPATSFLTVEIGEKLNDGIIEIFDVNSRQIGTFGLNELRNSIPVGQFANGNYFYKILDGKYFLNSGTFIIKK